MKKHRFAGASVDWTALRTNLEHASARSDVREINPGPDLPDLPQPRSGSSGSSE